MSSGHLTLALRKEVKTGKKIGMISISIFQTMIWNGITWRVAVDIKEKNSRLSPGTCQHLEVWDMRKSAKEYGEGVAIEIGRKACK